MVKDNNIIFQLQTMLWISKNLFLLTRVIEDQRVILKFLISISLFINLLGQTLNS